MLKRLFETLAHYVLSPDLDNRWEFWAFFLAVVIVVILAVYHNQLMLW